LETEKNILEDLFISVLLQFKKISPLWKFDNLSIFQSLKFRILIEKKSFPLLLI